MTVFKFSVVDGPTRRTVLIVDDEYVSFSKMQDAIMQIVRQSENYGQVVIEV